MTTNRSKAAVSILAAILLLCLYLLIFGMSGQDGEKSGNLSRYFSEKCVELINSLSGRRWTAVFKAELAAYFEHPLRKMAHFGEYACMGALVYAMWRPWKNRGKGLYLTAILWVFFSAAVDELHQWFVPDRYASAADVLLDTCGGAFAVFFCVLAEKCLQHRRRRTGAGKDKSPKRGGTSILPHM